MNDVPVFHDSSGPDWEAWLRKYGSVGIVEIDLTTLKPGDRLVVLTEHTAYSLVMREGGEADLTTSRGNDRPLGRVKIRGCTFGASTTIKPNHLFCGGNLEFGHGTNGEVSTTTTIRAMQILQTD